MAVRVLIVTLIWGLTPALHGADEYGFDDPAEGYYEPSEEEPPDDGEPLFYGDPEDDPTESGAHPTGWDGVYEAADSPVDEEAFSLEPGADLAPFDVDAFAFSPAPAQRPAGVDIELPLRLGASVDARYQIGGETPRWIHLGPTLSVAGEYRDPWIGSVVVDGELIRNDAHAIEEDSIATIDRFTNVAHFREIYWSRDFASGLSLAAGRKIVSWSNMRLAPLLGGISPRDLRDRAFALPEEQRLGQDLLEGSLQIAGHMVSVVAIPRGVTDVVPSGDHPYAVIPDVHTKIPDRLEWGARWATQVMKSRIALVVGDFLTRSPLLVTDFDTAELHAEVFPYRVLGVSADLPVGPVLGRFEFAQWHDLAHPVRLPSGLHTVRRGFSQGFVTGAEWASDHAGHVTVEYRSLFSDDGSAGHNSLWGSVERRIRGQLGVRWVGGLIDSFVNLVNRVQLSYDLSPAWQLHVGAAHVQMSDGIDPYLYADDWDRIEVGIAWGADLRKAAPQ